MKRLSLFLVPAFIFTAALFACNSNGGNEEAEKMPGRSIFVARNCTLCHGEHAEGKSNGPPLRNLKEHFSKDQLIAYIKNPAEYVKNDPRLSRNMQSYGAMMPSFHFLEEKELSVLADYLLAL